MRHLGIACGGDDNYATGIAVALYSALAHLSSDIIPTVYVLDGGLSVDHCERLERVITKVRPDSSIVWCRIAAADLAGLPVEGYLSKSAYLRLFLGHFVQERSKRIVYVDCDLLVVRDLSGVLDLDFGDYPIAAVRDFIFDDIAQLPKPLPEEQCVPWNGAAPCFNSGVLVIDWARYAALAVEEKALAYGKRVGGNPAVRGDQDMLNPVLAGWWFELPYTYNFFSQLLYIEEFVPKKRDTVLFSVKGVHSTLKQRYFTSLGSLNLGITGRRIRVHRCGGGLSGVLAGWISGGQSVGCCTGSPGEPSSG